MLKMPTLIRVRSSQISARTVSKKRRRLSIKMVLLQWWYRALKRAGILERESRRCRCWRRCNDICSTATENAEDGAPAQRFLARAPKLPCRGMQRVAKWCIRISSWKRGSSRQAHPFSSCCSSSSVLESHLLIRHVYYTQSRSKGSISMYNSLMMQHAREKAPKVRHPPSQVILHRPKPPAYERSLDT
jgi:hypothetical protein